MSSSVEEAVEAIRSCVRANQARLAKDPKAADVLKEIKVDPRFDKLRPTPEFKEAMGLMP